MGFASTNVREKKATVFRPADSPETRVGVRSAQTPERARKREQFFPPESTEMHQKGGASPRVFENYDERVGKPRF